MSNRAAQGLTLVELLVFIVIIGIAATAILAIFGGLTRNSGILLPSKQAQAIADGMMNEVMAQPFTFCDPYDAQAQTATAPVIGPTGCATLVEVMGPEPGETRGGPVLYFNNVNDYNAYATAGAALAGLPGLAGYAVQVAISPGAAAISGVPAADILVITVTVTPPTGPLVQLEGVRMQYAPNT
jgi:MSHA pilin protein MshD